MESLKACLLVPTPQNADRGLWFVFHHEADGILAFDLTTPHPDIPFCHFESFMPNTLREKNVLLGGPVQSDEAMLVLHNDANAGGDNHVINPGFSFFSRRFVLVPGMKPQITNADSVPSEIPLAPQSHALVVMGFRIWNMDELEQELANWQWYFLPASPDIVFGTETRQRLQRTLHLIN